MEEVIVDDFDKMRSVNYSTITHLVVPQEDCGSCRDVL
jgi:hypothetical protein